MTELYFIEYVEEDVNREEERKEAIDSGTFTGKQLFSSVTDVGWDYDNS